MATEVRDHVRKVSLCWLLLLTAFNLMNLHQSASETSGVSASLTARSISMESGGKNVFTAGALTCVMSQFLTGAGPLSVVVGILTTLLFFQTSLLQVIVQRSQQRVYVSLVSLQHQFCRTSEALEEEGSRKANTPLRNMIAA